MSQEPAWLPEPPPVTSATAADVRAPRAGEGSQVTYTYPIRQPERDLNDFQVGVRASVLERCRSRLSSVSAPTFPLGDLLLGAATLFAGAFLSALMSGVCLASWRGVLFYILSPIIATGTGVAFAFVRTSYGRSCHEAVKNVLDELPNPEHTKEI
jgi:hypothetical protein